MKVYQAKKYFFMVQKGISEVEILCVHIKPEVIREWCDKIEMWLVEA